MLSVYSRHYPPCTSDDINYKRCRCPKWINGVLGSDGPFIRRSAKDSELGRSRRVQTRVGSRLCGDAKRRMLTDCRRAEESHRTGCRKGERLVQTLKGPIYAALLLCFFGHVVVFLSGTQEWKLRLTTLQRGLRPVAETHT